MTDLPGRKTPRFPQALETAAREAIRAKILAATKGKSQTLTGIASGARGGDILFHEVCRANGISTTIVLPFNPADFIKSSVTGVPTGNWEQRFQSLWAATPEIERIILGLPVNSDAYAKCNAKIIELAAARGRFHLIALWDGGGGDGPGGTADLVARAIGQSDHPDIIDPRRLRPEGGRDAS